VLEEARSFAEGHEERWYEPEIHRMRGQLVLESGGDVAAAGRCFEKAFEIAREQGARSFELRSATSLSRLWQQQGKCAEARDLLQPVYDWFTEGFDTKDLKDARALLGELA
jgi:predicted ATPase